MSQAIANIDFLSSIPSEILQDSGPHGRVYDLQLSLARSQRRLENIIMDISEEYDAANRTAGLSGRIGHLTPLHEILDRDPTVIAARAEAARLTEEVAAAQEEIGGIVFLPAVDNLPEIEKRLASLNRKAGKLGTDPITLTVSDEKLILNYKSDDESTRGSDFQHVFAVLKGTTPQIPGFEFLASITPTEAGNVIKRIPAIRYGIRHNISFGHTREEERHSAAAAALDAIDLTRFRSTGDVCEHCHKDRRRNDLYIVYNEQTGEAIQVGRTCLRDYMGSNDPERVLKVLEQVWEFMRSMGERAPREILSTKTFLTHCAAILRVEHDAKGLGRWAANNIWLQQIQKKDDKGVPQWIEPQDQDEAAAEAILRWVADWTEESEFAGNVKLALSDTHIDPRLYGLGGAVFIARRNWEARAHERTAQQARQAAHAEKAHIGTVGERETFTLTVRQINWIANRYGYGDDAQKPLIIMHDAAGNDVKWFASDLPRVKSTDMPPVEGGTYTVKARVKRHEDDPRWGKSTTITRAVFETVINEPEEVNEEDDE